MVHNKLILHHDALVFFQKALNPLLKVSNKLLYVGLLERGKENIFSNFFWVIFYLKLDLTLLSMVTLILGVFLCLIFVNFK